MSKEVSVAESRPLHEKCVLKVPAHQTIRHNVGPWPLMCAQVCNVHHHQRAAWQESGL